MKKILFLCLIFLVNAKVSVANCPLAEMLMEKSRPDNAIKEYKNCGDMYGDILSLYNVASMYYKGQGVEVDFNKAATYFKKAANLGYAPAQTKLGVLYWRGEGVKQDLSLAYTWLFLASEDASKRWYYPIAMAYDQGLVNDKDESAMKYLDMLKESLLKDDKIVNSAMKEANSWKFRRLNEFAEDVLGDEYQDFSKELSSNARDQLKVSKILSNLKSKALKANIIK